MQIDLNHQRLESEGKRNKPRDMLYIAQDQPPWPTTLSVGMQHMMVALMLLLYSVIAGQAMGLAGDRLRDFVALGMLITGFGTLLNALTPRVSAGHLLVNFQSVQRRGCWLPLCAVILASPIWPN